MEGLEHRRVTVPAPAGAAPAPAGWQREEALVMLASQGDPPAWPAHVLEVEPETLHEPRIEMWRRHGSPYADELAAMQLAFATTPGTRCLAVRNAGGIVGWCQVNAGGIDDVMVLEEHRGRGLGRALVRGAVAAGGWYLLCSADDPRPQGLYRSEGFTDAGRVVQLTRTTE